MRGERAIAEVDPVMGGLLEMEERRQKNTLMLIADAKGNQSSRGELLHPVRYALSGLDRSPDPFIIASIIGKNETLSRLQKAI